MTAPAVRLGIVGCGLVAQRGYVPALAGIEDVRLTAAADPDPERRRLVAGIAAYPDLAAMLEAEELDAVLICSPPALHLEHAEQSARAGLRALVEKPPGLGLADALKLSALRPEPTLGFNRRFARGLPVGRGGAARVTAIFDAPPADWDRGNIPADPLLDFGCHLVDLGCWLTGTRPVRGRSIDALGDRVSFELDMSEGVRLYAECGAASSYRELVEIRTELGGAATWSWPHALPRQLANRLTRRPSPLIACWRAQLEAFADVVRGSDPGRLALARDGVPVMAALEAVQASASGNRDWVTVSVDHLQRGGLAG